MNTKPCADCQATSAMYDFTKACCRERFLTTVYPRQRKAWIKIFKQRYGEVPDGYWDRLEAAFSFELMKKND